MAHDGKVTIGTLLDNKGFEKGVGSVAGSLGGLKSVLGKLTGMIATAFSVKAVVAFGVESSKAAMELSNAFQGLQSIVEGQGKSFGSAKAFLNEYVKDGLIPMTNAVTAYKNLASRGYDDSQIQQTLIALKDASAYGRQASYSMGDAVQSATEGLKNENSVLVDNAGVTKNVAKMWDDYAKSIGTTAANLTQQQKIQAEVSGILEESKFQSGDAAKVAGTLSGQLQKLSFNFNNLKVAVGNMINPIVQALLPVLNLAISEITRFANYTASLFSALTGKSLDVSAGAGAISEGYTDAAESAQDLAAAVTEAGKAVKKSQAGFDQLNILQPPDAEENSAGADVKTGSISAGAVSVGEEIQDNVSPELQKLVKKIKDFGKEIKTAFAPSVSAWSKAFSGLSPAVENVGKRIGTAWNSLKDNALVPFGEYITTDFIPSIANEFSTTFAPIFADIMPVTMDLWSVDFQNKSLVIQECCNLLKLAYEGVKSAFSDMCNSISSNWETYGGALLQGLTDFKNGLWETWWYIYEKIINPVLTSWGETLTWLWDEHLKPFWDTAVEFFLSVGENILALWNGFLKPLIDWLVTVFAPSFLNMINGIIDAVAIVISVFYDVFGGVLQILQGLIQFVVGVFTLDWERAWGGIGKTFEGLWNSLSGIAKGAVNVIILAINKLLAAIYSGVAGIVNGLGSVVDTIGDMLGKDWGFSIPAQAPKIPYLAQGAVLPPNKPFMAVVGDQKHGTNIEAPLSTIQEAVAAVMQDYVNANMAGHEMTVSVLQEILEAVLGIQIGDDVIYNAVNRYNRKMSIVKGG